MIQSNCLDIVETRSGRGTGETLYRTQDGRWWREQPSTILYVNGTTGEETRWKHGGKLCDHWRRK